LGKPLEINIEIGEKEFGAPNNEKITHHTHTYGARA